MAQSEIQRIEVLLPQRHVGQRQVADEAKRFNVLACGRRWGKTTFGVDLACEDLLDGKSVGWFAPYSDYYYNPWEECKRLLYPLIKHKSETLKRLDLVTGGHVKFWSIADKADAGRGEKYHKVICDESAMTARLAYWWHNAGRATLADYQGDAWFLSTPRGLNGFHDLYQNHFSERRGWMSWQMPTSTNPYIALDELEELKELPERAYQQEILAQFLEDGSGVFRGVSAVISERVQDEPPQEGVFYQVGLDVARHEDFTVCTVLDQKARQVYFSRVNQVSWKRVVEVVKSVAANYRARVVMDSTGVGDAVYEMLVDEGVTVFPYTMTNASKASLVDNLAIMVENGRISLMDVQPQTQELLSYQYERLPSGKYRTSAPEGQHDDCVTALSLAAFGMDRHVPVASRSRLSPVRAPAPEPREEDAERFARNSARIRRLEGDVEKKRTRIR